MTGRPAVAALLLNAGHAIDHMFLLIFAASIGAIATDFGFARWEDLMPYGVGAFALFGLGSLPSGRLGDLWGRRRMMLWFYFGIGASSLAVWILGPLVKAEGFHALLVLMAATAAVTLCVVMLLPRSERLGLGEGAANSAPEGSAASE